MKQNKILYLLIGAVIIIVLLFGLAMFKLISENNQCVNNPFTYGARVIEEQGMPVICRCDSLDPDYIGFSYNKDRIFIDDKFTTTSFINISLPNYNEDEGGEGVPQ